MQSFEELWSSTEVRKLIRLFDADFRLTLDVLEAIPFPLAILSGPDLQVWGMNGAFQRVVERVPGFAGSHNPVAERILRDSDVPKRAATTAVTGVPQRNVRVLIGPNERVHVTIYPIAKRDNLLLVVEGMAAGTQSGVPVLDDTRVLQSLPFPIYTRDKLGALRYVNPALERLTGHTSAELLAMKTTDVFRTSPNGPISSLGRSPEAAQILTKRGSAVDVSLVEIPLTSEGDTVAVVQPLGREAREHEREAVMESLERISGQVAHRLNNMLTVILSYADLISKRFGSVESLRTDMAQIIEAGTKAAELTTQLLTFSRGRPGDASNTHVNAVISEFRVLLQGAISESVDLQLDLDEAAKDVLINPNDLETVILNLVTNANDSIEGTGRIVVCTRAGIPRDEDLPEKHYVQSWSGETVTICVRDNGSGIPPQYIESVFEPFITTKPGASGLGLAVVHGIVKKAGGMISISSQTGVGTTVWITLPAVPERSNPPHN